MSERHDTRGRLESFRNALRGIGGVLASQPNAWIHAAATVAVCALGAALGVSRLEWAALVIAIGSVWTAEVLNTAIERLGDVVSPDPHPLVAQAKDVAAGAVLISAAAAAGIGLLVLGPPLLRSLSG